MKKIIYFFVILSLFSLYLMRTVLSAQCTPCCCQTAPESGQYRCYNSGVCCLIGTDYEYWDPVSCHGLKMWVEPEKAMFTVGTKTRINIYIQNIGDYTDSYDIEVTKIPDLVLVDIIGSEVAEDLSPLEIKILHPRITVLSATATGDVEFKGTSRTDPTVFETANLEIYEGELPLSLPEFGFFGTIFMIILAGIVYFLIKKKH